MISLLLALASEPTVLPSASEMCEEVRVVLQEAVVYKVIVPAQAHLIYSRCINKFTEGIIKES